MNFHPRQDLHNVAIVRHSSSSASQRTASHHQFQNIHDDSMSLMSASITQDFTKGHRDSACSASSSSPEQNTDTLPFSSLGLVGRSNDKRALQEVIDGVIPSQQSFRNEESQHLSNNHDDNNLSPATASSQNTMVLISGHSGSGKSALAMHFEHQCFERHAFVVCGKFDLKQMEEPYSGIKAALADLCHQMLALKHLNESSHSVHSHSESTHESHDEDPRRFAVLQKLLVDGLSASEIEALSKVVPDILKVVKLRQQNSKTVQRPSSFTNITSELHAAETTRMGYREQSGRLKFALRRLLQISCQFCPVVMIIDDLQWGDEASIELLQSWMFMDAGGTSGHHSLLIMGCFRSDASSEHSAMLQRATGELKEAQEARSISIVEIHLGDMDVSQVHELVCGLLLPSNNKALFDPDSINKSNDSNPAVIGNRESLALAHVVHKRTGGNIFFVKQFLQQLFQDGLIYRDLGRWVWKSEAEIVEKSAATTNIAEMMKDKIQDIKAARQILPIAACLGATFSKSTLVTVLRSLSIHSDHAAFFRTTFDMPRIPNDSWVSDILQSCAREGLIESHHARSNRLAAQKGLNKKRSSRRAKHVSNSDMYSFVHDKVQEASFSLIPTDSVTELQYRVGEALSSCLKPDQLKDNIFMVASLLNLRHDLVPHSNRGNRRMKIAMLNKMAGERAVSCGAFQSALSYFKTAISLLPEDHWESQFRASLDLYSSVAECSSVASEMDQALTYTNQIIKQDCSILDKIRAYHIMIDIASAEAENNKGLDPVSLCLFVLSELGYKFPQSKVVQTFATLRGMLQMKRCVPKWTLQQFDDVPVCTDAKELAITKTLSKLSVVSYVARPDIVPLAIVKLVQRTLDHGISQYTLSSFCLLGIIVGYFMGDFHSAHKLGQISLRLIDRVECQETKSMTMAVAYSMCLHWTSPVEDSMALQLQSYQVGMATGELESAAWGIYNHIHAHLVTGTSLSTVDGDLSKYTKVLKDFHQMNQYHMCAIMSQMVKNLKGKTDNGILLVGDAYDEVAELQRLEAEPDHQRQLFINTMKLHAALHLGDFAAGAKIAAETYDERLKKHAGIAALPPAVFDSGMCCYAVCFDESISAKLRKKYKKTAQKSRTKLCEWQEKGNINCDHYVAILDAERHALIDRYEPAVKNYAIAIALTRSRGYIQYEALATERLADHLLKGGKFESEAKQYILKAIALTKEWGATAKVKRLHAKYNGPLTASSSY